MALVDDNGREVILRIKGSQEIGIAVVVLHAKGLVGSDVDAGVLGVVGAVRLAKDLGSVGAKEILKSLESLGAQFVSVADEQGAGELPGIRDTLEHVNGDEGLARTSGQREQRTFGLIIDLAPGDLLHHGTDGGVLVVAPNTFAAGVRLKQRPSGR